MTALESSKISKQHLVDSEKDEILLDLQREEDKEEEYDYFNQDDNDENLNHAGDYHIMEDNIGNEDDEEMLDDDEIRERNLHMLKEL